MKLKDVQNSMFGFLSGNQIGNVILQFSLLFLLVYPCYLLIGLFDFLDPITDIFIYFREVMYFAYLIGLVACFAKNEMLFVALAFAVKTLMAFVGFVRMIDASYDPALYNYFNYIIEIAGYGFITYVAFMLSQKKAE